MFRATHTLIAVGALLTLPPMHGVADACGVKLIIRHHGARPNKRRPIRSRATRNPRPLVAASSGASGRVVSRSGGSRDRFLVRSRSPLARPSTPAETRGEPAQDTGIKRIVRRVSSRASTRAVAQTPAAKYAVPDARDVAPRKVASAFEVEVFFDIGKASIGSSTLDPAVAWLQSHSSARLVIEGHTDASGSAAFNRRLSVRRAKAVRSLLVDRTGASVDRIRVVGFGESRLADPEDASKNRRVVIGSR